DGGENMRQPGAVEIKRDLFIGAARCEREGNMICGEIGKKLADARKNAHVTFGGFFEVEITFSGGKFREVEYGAIAFLHVADDVEYHRKWHVLRGGGGQNHLQKFISTSLKVISSARAIISIVKTLKMRIMTFAGSGRRMTASMVEMTMCPPSKTGSGNRFVNA